MFVLILYMLTASMQCLSGSSMRDYAHTNKRETNKRRTCNERRIWRIKVKDPEILGVDTLYPFPIRVETRLCVTERADLNFGGLLDYYPAASSSPDLPVDLCRLLCALPSDKKEMPVTLVIIPFEIGPEFLDSLTATVPWQRKILVVDMNFCDLEKDGSYGPKGDKKCAGRITLLFTHSCDPEVMETLRVAMKSEFGTKEYGVWLYFYQGLMKPGEPKDVFLKEDQAF